MVIFSKLTTCRCIIVACHNLKTPITYYSPIFQQPIIIPPIFPKAPTQKISYYSLLGQNAAVNLALFEKMPGRMPGRK